MDNSYAVEVAECVKMYVEGPLLPVAGSMMAASVSENRIIERWRYELSRRVGPAMRRADGNIAGLSILSSIWAALTSDRFIDQHDKIIDRALEARG